AGGGGGSGEGEGAGGGRGCVGGGAPCPPCHSGPELSDGNTRLHPVADAMGEPEPPGVPSYASRSATKMYRTSPLKGVWQHPPYFHNGTAATLEDVLNTSNTRRSLRLTPAQVSDPAQYLKSLWPRRPHPLRCGRGHRSASRGACARPARASHPRPA